jgi:hypothetical protein
LTEKILSERLFYNFPTAVGMKDYQICQRYNRIPVLTIPDKEANPGAQRQIVLQREVSVLHQIITGASSLYLPHLHKQNIFISSWPLRPNSFFLLSFFLL